MTVDGPSGLLIRRVRCAYRLIAQFNLSYDSITAITIEQGYSEIDELYNGLQSDSFEIIPMPLNLPYFDLSLSRGESMNGWSLGKSAMTVTDYDRQLGTVDVTVRAVLSDGSFTELELTVPGTYIDDRSGYLRNFVVNAMNSCPLTW